MKAKFTMIRNAVIIAAISLFSHLASAQTYNNMYRQIDVFSPSGQNPSDFIFSYDVVNGFHSCVNNFEVVNNFNYTTTFQFRIYVNTVLVYTGNVTIVAYGSVFFNDAFTNCISAGSAIEVRII